MTDHNDQYIYAVKLPETGEYVLSTRRTWTRAEIDERVAGVHKTLEPIIIHCEKPVRIERIEPGDAAMTDPNDVAEFIEVYNEVHRRLTQTVAAVINQTRDTSEAAMIEMTKAIIARRHAYQEAMANKEISGLPVPWEDVLKDQRLDAIDLTVLLWYCNHSSRYVAATFLRNDFLTWAGNRWRSATIDRSIILLDDCGLLRKQDKLIVPWVKGFPMQDWNSINELLQAVSAAVANAQS